MAPRQIKHIEEKELVGLLQKHDKAALEYVYDSYSSALFGVILRIVRDEAVAEEVMQDAFVKIWKNIDNYDPLKGRLFTWMLNISRNLAIDKTRSKEIKNEKKTDQVDNNVSKLNSQSYSEVSVDGIGVKELLDNLNPEQKLVVDLLYFKGYTQSEVSEEYDIPLGTVKTRLRIALKHLRKILNQVGS